MSAAWTERSRRFWERNAARYDASMVLLGGPLPRMIGQVAEAVRGSPRVLELASGTGRVTAGIAPVVGSLLATDYAAPMVRLTQARVAAWPQVRCAVRDLYALGEPAGAYDAVVAANVLHLLPDLEGGLAVMRAALAPQGRLVVPTFCHAQNLWARIVSGALSLISFPAARRFSLSSLTAAVEAAGFTIVQAELLPGLLPIGFVVATPRSAGP